MSSEARWSVAQLRWSCRMHGRETVLLLVEDAFGRLCLFCGQLGLPPTARETLNFALHHRPCRQPDAQCLTSSAYARLDRPTVRPWSDVFVVEAISSRTETSISADPRIC